MPGDGREEDKRHGGGAKMRDEENEGELLRANGEESEADQDLDDSQDDNKLAEGDKRESFCEKGGNERIGRAGVNQFEGAEPNINNGERRAAEPEHRLLS